LKHLEKTAEKPIIYVTLKRQMAEVVAARSLRTAQYSRKLKMKFIQYHTMTGFPIVSTKLPGCVGCLLQFHTPYKLLSSTLQHYFQYDVPLNITIIISLSSTYISLQRLEICIT
jgi:hypothetical protein